MVYGRVPEDFPPHRPKARLGKTPPIWVFPYLGLPHDTSLLVDHLLRERPYSGARYLRFGCVSDLESDATGCTMQVRHSGHEPVTELRPGRHARHP